MQCMSLWLWPCLCDVLASLCAQEHCKDFFVLKMNCNFRGQDFFTFLMLLIRYFFGTLATTNLDREGRLHSTRCRGVACFW